MLNYAEIPFSNRIDPERIFEEDEIDAALDNISLWWCQIPKTQYKKIIDMDLLGKFQQDALH